MAQGKREISLKIYSRRVMRVFPVSLWDQYSAPSSGRCDATEILRQNLQLKAPGDLGQEGVRVGGMGVMGRRREGGEGGGR